jgi:hypothetical protein
LSFSTHRDASPAQFRLIRQRNAGAEPKKGLPNKKMGFDPQKRLAKSHKTGNVEDRIWCELMKLHTINIKKPMKELVGRKRESVEKKRKEHLPVAARGLGDPLGARKDDGVVVGDETFHLGLVQLLLRESKGHPACCGVRHLPLGHLVIRRQVLHTHL